MKRPTRPTVALRDGSGNFRRSGDYGLDDHDRQRVAEHDERGAVGMAQAALLERMAQTLGHLADAVSPPRKSQARSSMVKCAAYNLPAFGATAELTPATQICGFGEGDSGQIAVSIWKSTPTEFIFVGSTPEDCSVNVGGNYGYVVRLETAGKLYAKRGTGSVDRLNVAIEYTS